MAFTGCVRNACEQWQRGIIPNPATFLNQEQWKDTPPAGETKPGEIRVREATPGEREEAKEHAEFFRLMRVTPGKSEAEVLSMIRGGTHG